MVVYPNPTAKFVPQQKLINDDFPDEIFPIKMWCFSP
jgi:hypothetical protein